MRALLACSCLLTLSLVKFDNILYDIWICMKTNIFVLLFLVTPRLLSLQAMWDISNCNTTNDSETPITGQRTAQE